MKIKVLKSVVLDVEGKQKTYSPSNKIIEISDELAKENNYVERYEKYPRHIQIVELPKVEKNPKEVDQEVEEKPKEVDQEVEEKPKEVDQEVEEKPKAKKATKKE